MLHLTIKITIEQYFILLFQLRVWYWPVIVKCVKNQSKVFYVNQILDITQLLSLKCSINNLYIYVSALPLLLTSIHNRLTINIEEAKKYIYLCVNITKFEKKVFISILIYKNIIRCNLNSSIKEDENLSIELKIISVYQPKLLNHVEMCSN
jgi:hypothetical protein